MKFFIHRTLNIAKQSQLSNESRSAENLCLDRESISPNICFWMMATRAVRHSVRICNLLYSFSRFPACCNIHCKTFSTSKGCCYKHKQHKFLWDIPQPVDLRRTPLPLAYDKYDPPNSDKPPIVEYPLIIQHGIFGNKVYWQAVAKSLAENLRQSVVCCDARNHGDSPRDPVQSLEVMSEDIEELIDTLKTPKAILMGHSMGGKVVMCNALRKPEVVDTLIIVDTSPAQMPAPQDFRTFVSSMKALDITTDETLTKMRERGVKEFEKAIPNIRVRGLLMGNLVENDGKIEWKVNLEAFGNHLTEIIDEFPEFHNSYSGPTLVIVGDKSDYVTEKEKPEIKRLFPEAVFETLPGTHWVHADSPKETIACIVNFLKNSRGKD